MSTALGYSYDKVVLKRHWYRPILHWQIDDMDMALREGFVKIMKGEQAFPVKIVGVEQAQPAAMADAAEQPGGKPELPPA